MYSSSRYLLCRPANGFNDTLCVIARCWAYAEAYNRELIIDTRYTFSGFMDDLDNYFVIKKGATNVPVRFSLTASELNTLNNMSTYPKILQGKLHTYKTKKLPGGCGFIEVETGVQPRFDITTDYNEQLLVYNWYIGGSKSLQTLQRLQLNPITCEFIKEQLSRSPKDYVAVHVRNTDQRQDYKTFFNTINDELAGKNVLICSDNFDCIKYAKKVFTTANTFTVSNIPNLHGKPLHKYKKNRKEINLAVLTDLFAMALSNKLYYTTATNRGSGLKISGFLRLAKKLQANPDILSQLLLV